MWFVDAVARLQLHGPARPFEAWCALRRSLRAFAFGRACVGSSAKYLRHVTTRSRAGRDGMGQLGSLRGTLSPPFVTPRVKRAERAVRGVPAGLNRVSVRHRGPRSTWCLSTHSSSSWSIGACLACSGWSQLLTFRLHSLSRMSQCRVGHPVVGSLCSLYGSLCPPKRNHDGEPIFAASHGGRMTLHTANEQEW